MPASVGEMVMTQQAARRLALHLQPVPLEERAEGTPDRGWRWEVLIALGEREGAVRRRREARLRAHRDHRRRGLSAPESADWCGAASQCGGDSAAPTRRPGFGPGTVNVRRVHAVDGRARPEHDCLWWIGAAAPASELNQL
jgi:hypothetical protein